MFALLRLKVSGFRMLVDDFTLDFLTKARAISDDSEIIKIDENLYTYNLIAFTGSNSHGNISEDL